jgi:hypothetical protein
VGGGLPINDFEITVFGFGQYAKAYIPDHDSMVESVIDQIVRLKKDVFDKPDIVVEHTLDKLVADGQLRIAKFTGGKIRITHVSAQLRRKYEDDEAERSADESEPRRDSIHGAAVELGEEIRFKAERDAWWTSDKGQASAKKEVEHLFNELQRLGDEITNQESQMAASFENDGQGFCILYCRGISLTASWNPGRFVNKLEGSGLHMKLTEGRISLSQNVVEVDEPKEIRHVRYDIDMASTREIGWRETQGSKQVLASPKVAEMWVRNLIDEVRKRVASELRQPEEQNLIGKQLDITFDKTGPEFIDPTEVTDDRGVPRPCKLYRVTVTSRSSSPVTRLLAKGVRNLTEGRTYPPLHLRITGKNDSQKEIRLHQGEPQFWDVVEKKDSEREWARLTETDIPSGHLLRVPGEFMITASCDDGLNVTKRVILDSKENGDLDFRLADP